MPTEIERLQVRLEVTQRRFERELQKSSQTATRRANQIERRFDQMNTRVRRSFDGTALAFGGLGRSLLAGLSTREVARYADTWTVAGNKIAAASQVAGRQARSLEELNDIATQTRSGIAETADLYAKLLRATKGVAESEEEVARATEIVNKAFKAGGAAASEQAAGILQLAQGLSSGILQGDELRSIRENAPLVAQAIADEFKTTIGGLKDLGSEGKLTSDRVFRAIINAQAPIEAAFAQTNQTIAESFTILRNSLTEYVGTGAQSLGISEKIATALSGLAANLDVAAKAGVILGARFIGPVLLGQLARVVPVVTAAAVSMRGLSAGATLAAGSIGVLRGVLAVFGGPIGAAVAGLFALDAILDRLPNKEKSLQTAIDNVTLAMSDEIRQIQNILSLQPGANTLTVESARAKLQEAEAIYTKLQAQREEVRTLTLASEAYQAILESIDSYRERLNTLASPGADLEQVPAKFRSAYQEAEAGLAAALADQQRLLSLTGENSREYEQAAALVAKWREALEGATRQTVTINGEIGDGVILTDRLSDAANSVDFSGAANSAAALADQLGIAVSNALALQQAGRSASAQDEDAAFAVPVVPNSQQRARNRGASANIGRISSRGSRSGGGGGGGSSREPVDLFEGVERDLAQLELQQRLVGKNAEEAAKLRAEFDLLAIAKREGIDVDRQRAASGRTLREEFELQAQAVGELTRKLDEARNRESVIEAGLDNIASTLTSATDSWENFGDAAVSALKRILLEYAKASVLDGLGSLFGRPGDRVGGTFLGAIGIPGFATGTRSAPGGVALVGERGPELVNLPRGAEVVPNSQIGNAMGGQVELVVRSDAGTVVEVVRNTAGAMIQQNNDNQNRALPDRIQQIQRDPRKR